MTYNAFLELTSLSYAGGTTSFTYDDDGLMTALSDVTVERAAVSGWLEGMSDGTLQVDYGYSGFGELAETAWREDSEKWDCTRRMFYEASINSAVLHLRLANAIPTARRRELSQFFGIMAKEEGLAGAALRQYGYVYDDLGRLTAVRDGNDVLLESYAYDVNDRRIADRTGRAYVYDADDRLLSVGDGPAAVWPSIRL